MTQPPTVAGRPCHWCKRPMTRRRRPDERVALGTAASRDHVVPKAKGGTAKVWACNRCNNLKGDMMPDDWMAWMMVNPEKVAW